MNILTFFVETLNVWTHLLAAFAVVGWMVYCLGTGDDDFTFFDTLMVTAAFLGCLVCYLSSACKFSAFSFMVNCS